jgi:hypothetical protein
VLDKRTTHDPLTNLTERGMAKAKFHEFGGLEDLSEQRSEEEEPNEQQGRSAP